MNGGRFDITCGLQERKLCNAKLLRGTGCTSSLISTSEASTNLQEYINILTRNTDMPSIKSCLFHDFPLEVREMIYREAMQEWIDQPIIWRDNYPFTYANSSEIERALIPEKDLYREALAVRLRHSTLVLAQPDESKMTREEPLKRHPIEELSLLARHCIRKVTVEVPG
jgi:hypothetical protein